MSPVTMYVAGQAAAAEPQMKLFGPAQRAAVRYADALSWTAATAVSLALAGLADGFKTVRHQTGLITISAEGPADTIAALAETTASGFSSPIRYPAAGPGSLGGVTCIMHDLRGPTMNFTMPPELALPTALMLAGGWIEGRGTPLVVLLVSRRIAQGKYRARCILLGRNKSVEGSAQPFSPAHAEWLLSQAET